jgi:phage terminase large subunit
VEGRPPRQSIVIDYEPRTLQWALHDAIAQHRWTVAVTHRRFGKTVCGGNHLQRACLACKLPRPRFHYIAPTYRMGKAIAWDYLKFYARDIPGVQTNESELRINYPNEGQVQILGADSPDSMRGIYSDGALFDEFGMQPPNVFTEIIRPALADRGGWAAFFGTPNGKNQFYDIVQQARAAMAAGDLAWFLGIYKASETGILNPKELEAARSVMTQDEYDQEFECSFEAAVKGAIYSAELQAARIARADWNSAYRPYPARGY